MSNPILNQLSPESIIELEHEELYKLANVIKFSEPEIIPILEKYENGIDLDFSIKHYLDKGGMPTYTVTVRKGKNGKFQRLEKRSIIGKKRYDSKKAIEELDKREAELKFALIKLLNKEGRIKTKSNSDIGINLSMDFVLDIDVDRISRLLLILELIEKSNCYPDISQQKERILNGINERFYIKNLWNGYKLELLSKGKQNKFYYRFLNEKGDFEKDILEKEMIDRRDLAKATIIQALSSGGDLIEASELKEEDFENGN